MFIASRKLNSLSISHDLVRKTMASTEELRRNSGFTPNTPTASEFEMRDHASHHEETGEGEKYFVRCSRTFSVGGRRGHD